MGAVLVWSGCSRPLGTESCLGGTCADAGPGDGRSTGQDGLGGQGGATAQPGDPGDAGAEAERPAPPLDADRDSSSADAPVDAPVPAAAPLDAPADGAPETIDTIPPLKTPPVCLDDADCGRGTLCWSNFCQPLPPCPPGFCSAGSTCWPGCAPTQNPCAGVKCATGETCVNGTCVQGCYPSCANVTCPSGEYCWDGACNTITPCGLPCGEGKTCTLGCLPPPPCGGACKACEICTTYGACVHDPCCNVACAAGQECRNGVCVNTCGGEGSEGTEGAEGGGRPPPGPGGR